MLHKLPHIAYILDDFYLSIFPPVSFIFQPRVGITLLVSLNSEPFTLQSESGEIKYYSAALLNRQDPITYKSDSCSCLEINFLPLTTEYHSLTPFINSQSHIEITFDKDISQEFWISDIVKETADATQLSVGCKQILDSIKGYLPTEVKPDKRAIYVAENIREQLPKINLLEFHASTVGLSGNRLSHLFKDELHMPIKSYILVEKVKRGGYFINQGMSITEASQEAGFADSAHFTRSFKEFFGITPRRMLDSVNVHFL